MLGSCRYLGRVLLSEVVISFVLTCLASNCSLWLPRCCLVKHCSSATLPLDVHPLPSAGSA